MHQDIDFPELARRVLQAKGLSMHKLARELGVTQPTVSRLAAGKQQELGVRPALRLIVLAGGQVVLPPDETLRHAA